MTSEIVSVACGGPGVKLPDENKVRYYHNEDNEDTPCFCYQSLLEYAGSHSGSNGIWEPTDILIYIHDDVTIHDPSWIYQVMNTFDWHDDCVCVGLGGASALGHPNINKTPYRIEHMARRGYVSNQTDWQVHGGHEEGACCVAVVDAFFMAVRTNWLRTRRTFKPHKFGVDRDGTMDCDLGWPVSNLTHHCLDLWLACEAAKDNKEIWMVGASCTHHGGGSSTKPSYTKAKWLQGGSLEEDHRQPHYWLYQNYRDVLPIEVK